MADLASQINGARKGGYSDDEITTFLGRSHPELVPKIQSAQKGGYNSQEILEFLSKAPSVIPGMEKLGGTPPGPPKPPLPTIPSSTHGRVNISPLFTESLGSTAPVRGAYAAKKDPRWLVVPAPVTVPLNPRTGLPMRPGSGPLSITDWPSEGIPQMGQGVSQVSDWDTTGMAVPPKSVGDQLAGGAHKIFRGGMQTIAPVALPYAAVAAPWSLATGLPAATAVGTGTEAGLRALGTSPEKSAFAGDLTSLLAGWGVGRSGIGSNPAEAGRGFKEGFVRSLSQAEPSKTGRFLGRLSGAGAGHMILPGSLEGPAAGGYFGGELGEHLFNIPAAVKAGVNRAGLRIRMAQAPPRVPVWEQGQLPAPPGTPETPIQGAQPPFPSGRIPGHLEGRPVAPAPPPRVPVWDQGQQPTPSATPEQPVYGAQPPFPSGRIPGHLREGMPLPPEAPPPTGRTPIWEQGQEPTPPPAPEAPAPGAQPPFPSGRVPGHLRGPTLGEQMDGVRAKMASGEPLTDEDVDIVKRYSASPLAPTLTPPPQAAAPPAATATTAAPEATTPVVPPETAAPVTEPEPPVTPPTAPGVAEVPPETGTTSGTAKPVDLNYVLDIAKENGETVQKTLHRWLFEAWKDAYGPSKDTHANLSGYLKQKYGLDSMTKIKPQDALNEFHILKDIAIKKAHENPMLNPPAVEPVESAMENPPQVEPVKDTPPSKPKPVEAKPPQASLYTAPEMRALAEYRSESNPVNTSLRTEGSATHPDIASIDSALAKHSLPEQTTLYRGFDRPTGYAVGDTFTDKGYSSTSTDIETAALEFGRRGEVAVIEVPKGTNAVDMSGISHPDVWAPHDQGEVLLPRGMKYTVRKIEFDPKLGPDGKNVLYLDAVPAAVETSPFDVSANEVYGSPYAELTSAQQVSLKNYKSKTGNLPARKDVDSGSFKPRR